MLTAKVSTSEKVQQLTTSSKKVCYHLTDKSSLHKSQPALIQTCAQHPQQAIAFGAVSSRLQLIEAQSFIIGLGTQTEFRAATTTKLHPHIPVPTADGV